MCTYTDTIILYYFIDVAVPVVFTGSCPLCTRVRFMLILHLPNVVSHVCHLWTAAPMLCSYRINIICIGIQISYLILLYIPSWYGCKRGNRPTCHSRVRSTVKSNVSIWKPSTCGAVKQVTFVVSVISTRLVSISTRNYWKTVYIRTLIHNCTILIL